MLTAALLATLAGFSADPTKTERASGWKNYSGSDASSLWQGYRQKSFPAKGWALEGGELKQTGPGGGDLVTAAQFTDVEMICDFKLDKESNSGIMWRVTETTGETYMTGPEYQLLDDAGWLAKGALKDSQLTGSLYDLLPAPKVKLSLPAGEWNQARIYIRNGLVQHWLNAKKVAEVKAFESDGKPTKQWQALIAASKFKDAPGFGIQPKGALALQDHGGGIAFRDIKIRDLSAPSPGEIQLWNGKDLTGWQAIVPEAKDKGIKPEDVWYVKDGELICKGTPAGYIRTTKDYKNFIIKLEWRFDPTKGAGNSGVLFRMVGQDKVWPKSVEAQLQSGQAGDFWNIDDVKMTVAKDRTNGRNTKRTSTAERPIGDWNEYEIIVDHGLVILKVNGEELNRATDVEEVAGKICLQSEGSQIHFRNIRLIPLD